MLLLAMSPTDPFDDGSISGSREKTSGGWTISPPTVYETDVLPDLWVVYTCTLGSASLGNDGCRRMVDGWLLLVPGTPEKAS